MVGGAHELHGAAGALDDEVGHVADEVGGEAEVEEHVEDVEDHLDGVLGVEVAVADGGHGGDGPVDGGDVADPQAGLPEVGDGRADPRLVPVRVPVGDQVVEAAGAVHQEQRHLRRPEQDDDASEFSHRNRWCVCVCGVWLPTATRRAQRTQK